MIELIHIHVSRRWVPDHLFRLLVGIVPDGAIISRRWGQEEETTTSWQVDLPLSDSRVGQILELLSRERIVRDEYPKWKPAGRGVTIWLDRKYSRVDLQSSILLAIEGHKHVESYWRTENLSPKFSAVGLQKCKADVVSGNWPGLVIPDRVRRVIEESGLSHVVFAPVTPVRKNSESKDESVVSWESCGPPWWELASDVVMPPLSPVMEIVGQDGSPFVGYECQWLSIREGIFLKPEMHYRRHDLPPVDQFDLAYTHEHFGKPPRGQRLIASQRLFQLFQKHHLKAKWQPIRIDE